MSSKKNEVSIASKLKIKHIPDVGYDFNDVIENVEKLMDHFFNTSMDEIKSTIDKLATKYSNKIDYDYCNLFHLAENTKAFDQWNIMHMRISKGKVDPAFHLMDMYFQMRMVENFDFYNDVLIYNYTEDIQPFLK